MDSIDFQGVPGDIERFAHQVIKQSVTVEELSPYDHRMRWEGGGTAGFGSIAHLRSGLKLSTSKFSWDKPWGFRFSDAAIPLKFMLGRGVGPRFTPSDSPAHVLGNRVLQVMHSTQPLSTMCQFVQGGGEFEQLAIEIDPARLSELLGGPLLPRVLETLVHSTAAQELHEQPMVPSVSSLFEEILYADPRKRSRSIFLEAKALELLALLIDELTLSSEAMSPLGQRDVERIERARRVLYERMVCPPSVPELARIVGINEFKLKAGFRSLFGTTVFGYLRVQRMDLARQLLVRRDVSVSEVAVRVGYANPSKFAAAFRLHYGVPPSAFR